MIGGHREEIRTTMSENVLGYLTCERIDAIVTGLLYFAIKCGYDFQSTMPITSELKYNIERHIVPALSCNPGFYFPAIKAPVAEPVPRTGEIVATGCSCGVDSLYTVATNIDCKADAYRLNHLTFFDVGSHMCGPDKPKAERVFQGRLEMARSFAAEIGLPLVEMRSDIHLLIDKYDPMGYNHMEHDTYMMGFLMMLIQRGIRTYLCSSSNTYEHFRVKMRKGRKIFGCDNYELLLMAMFSFGGTKYISAGGSIARVEKVKLLCDYPLAWKYLNVCVSDVENDSVCGKCVRTLMAIDAFDALDKFRPVFDIDHYRAHRRDHMAQMYIEGKYKGWLIVRELFPYYKREMNAPFKMYVQYYRLSRFAKRAVNFIKRKINR